jgi:hypothetical protein
MPAPGSVELRKTQELNDIRHLILVSQALFSPLRATSLPSGTPRTWKYRQVTNSIVNHFELN